MLLLYYCFADANDFTTVPDYKVIIEEGVQEGIVWLCLVMGYVN